ncbi:MAG: glycosyltransferase family 39 protein [Pirellulales bacterium]
MDRRRLFYSSIVAAVAAAALLTNLGKPRLWDRDEPRNAQCAVEMRARGDWIVPTFNDELRAHKPVLLYWLMRVSYAALGETEFAARLPSAVMGLATALVVLAMAWRLFSPRAGLWAGLILATSLSFDIAGRAATPDAALLFCVTAAMAAFVFSATSPAGVPRKPNDAADALPGFTGWVVVYAMFGLAVLAKGPVGLVLGVAILGLNLLTRPNSTSEPTAPSRRRWIDRITATLHPRRMVATAWRMRPLTLIAVVLAVAAPWYVAVHRATGGAFTDEFFFRHNFERATSAMEGHQGPLVYYLGAALVGFFPWSIFAVPVALETFHVLRSRASESVGAAFALCWAGVWIAAFSLVGTKLPSYITPAYPALAMLAGLYVDRWLAGTAVSAARWTPWVFAALATVGGGLALGLPVMARHYLPGDELLGVLGLIPLATAAVGWWCVRRGNIALSATTLAVGATVLVVAMFGFAQVRIDRRQVSEDLAALVRREGGETARLAAYRDLEPSMVFYAGHPIATLFDPAAAGALLERQERAYLLASDEDLPELRRHLPADVEVIARRSKFLQEGEVVVLGRTPQTLALRHDTAKAIRSAKVPQRDGY